ncbi:MAG: acetoacetate--CoA ligase [Myxococcota bacterium]|nr:acetoacetate--CoA ligase [Myxococcota bacterium]
MSEAPLWAPDPGAASESPMAALMAHCAALRGAPFASYDELHAWSVSDREGFWSAVWDHADIVGEKGDVVLRDGDEMPGAAFFPEARLSFAENLLRQRGPGDAIVFRGEDRVALRLSWDELRARVSRLQQAFEALGVGPGDRVAAMLPNLPDTVAAMLAATSLGAIWSSCSPDFGERGVLDRFGQIAPKVFLVCDGYWYAGRLQDVDEKAVAVARELGSHTLVVPYVGRAAELAAKIEGARDLETALAPHAPGEPRFTRLPFGHPLYVLFSSGTTGIPKCIVHSAGGTLIQHLKEQRYHCGLEPGQRLFYFTTCGWMMWNWLVSGLASGTTLCLYDGSPFHPGPEVLFDYARDERFDFFGTSAKFIDAVRKAGLEPARTHDLSSVRTIASTGSPLSPEGFDFVYGGIRPGVHLASISGGTDIVSCFVLGIPTKPVWRGEIQGPGLGMAVDVFDEEGRPVRGEKGELVCTRPFPSMPVGFWNDPDGARYHAAYFDRFPGIWCHGDFAEWTTHGGMVIHGRSDATLNPGGVRIGTAEIYNQVERMDEVVEALCVGQEWDGDVRVVLFVRLAEGVALDDELVSAIQARIRSGASPRHVPARVLAVDDIPRTKSGKITELAVREVIHGRPVKNVEALANPEALEHFAGRAELRS